MLIPRRETRRVRIRRFRGGEGGSTEVDDAVAAEEPMEIRVAWHRPGGGPETTSVAVTMRTPGDDFELAVGFLLTEGLVRSRREVVGVGFARNLEHGQGDLFGDSRALGEPLAISPGLQHGFGVGVASLGLAGYVVEGIKHQQGVLELFGGDSGQFGVVEQFDHGGDVVAALHGAQQFNGTLFGQQRGGGFTLGDCRQETSLDVGGFVNPRGDAVGQQIKQEFFFTGRRVFQ